MTRQREFSRYLLVGGINFFFTFLVFTAALKFLHLDHLLSLLLAWVTGNILTYVLNFLWVFRPEAQLVFGIRFLKYLGTGACSVGVNVLALFALVDLWEYDAFWSQVAFMPVIVILNYCLTKFWSLRTSELH